MLRRLVIWWLQFRICFRSSLIKRYKKNPECTCDAALLRARNYDDATRVAYLRKLQRRGPA